MTIGENHKRDSLRLGSAIVFVVLWKTAECRKLDGMQLRVDLVS